jgi:hypothetical protein
MLTIRDFGPLSPKGHQIGGSARCDPDRLAATTIRRFRRLDLIQNVTLIEQTSNLRVGKLVLQLESNENSKRLLCVAIAS